MNISHHYIEYSPFRLRVLSMFSTFDSVLKLTISPHAEGAETDPCQGTPTMAHFQTA